ncbi:hypothetical protein RhiirA5_446266 [Rhizophagus irregularis]|uniref:Uncharacterized protein n=1 Tax=Rhizophagus irregularis TaxID=588596 RepID=A0A2N0NC00_9GLOM|nr:hypothetical protein RhiirA5_446266 [Rhizophagus irregularis]
MVQIVDINGICEKINIEDKKKFVKDERKIYIITIIIALVMVPCSVNTELRTDKNII